MPNNLKLTNYAPFLIVVSVILLFVTSYTIGSRIVLKSEKELNTKKQKQEAKAGEYTLEEIDTKSGELRWRLTAKEGLTKDNLQNAQVKGISAKIYKNNQVIFELEAPYAKTSYQTNEIYLYGNVTVKDQNNDFLLTSNRISLGMDTSIEAQEGFSLILQNTGTIKGERALINGDKTNIIVKNLYEANLKEIKLSGIDVTIEKDKDSTLKKALITSGGEIILTNKNNSSLSADNILWEKDGDVKANGNVIFKTEDKILKAKYLTLKSNNKFYAKNNVHITHGNTSCSGNYLSYEDNNLIVISGSPKAVQENKQITADKIVYDTKSGKVEAIGNVKTLVTTQTGKS